MIENLPSKQHLTVLIDNKSNQTGSSIPRSNRLPIKTKYENESSQIILSQFIKDINTNIETKIDSAKVKLKMTPELKLNYNEDNLKNSPSSKTTKPCSLTPTVPRCLNEYFHKNFNSLSNKKHMKLNIFDSGLFQWEIFNKNQNENYFSRKNSSMIINQNESSIKSFINFIQSQRQYVPSEYSSWNIPYSNYHPLNFSLKKPKTLNINSSMKNPYGRTGLLGQSLFDKYGPNRFIISLIITEKTNKKFILLKKNQYNKWELPKTKYLKKNIHYSRLDRAYLDHPLNTDDAWIEVDVILIKTNSLYKDFHEKQTWFLMKHLYKLNSIESFDLNLIQSYL